MGGAALLRVRSAGRAPAAPRSSSRSSASAARQSGAKGDSRRTDLAPRRSPPASSRLRSLSSRSTCWLTAARVETVFVGRLSGRYSETLEREPYTESEYVDRRRRLLAALTKSIICPTADRSVAAQTHGGWRQRPDVVLVRRFRRGESVGTTRIAARFASSWPVETGRRCRSQSVRRARQRGRARFAASFRSPPAPSSG